MISARNATTLGLLALLILQGGCAVDPESRVYLTGMATFIDDDPERDVDEGLSGYHLGVGRDFGDNYKLEIAAVGSRMNADGFDADQEQLGIGIDILRKLGGSSHFYPYAVAGFGHLRTRRTGPSRPDYNGPMVSLGLGIITPINFMDQAIRAEIRLRNDSGDTAGELYQDYLLSVGLHFPLGKQPVRRTDSDGDGVDDSRDQCAGTRAGLAVDDYGCALDVDSDMDGVPDVLDMCGGTPRGAAVDPYGCARRSPTPGDDTPQAGDGTTPN